MDLTNVHNRKTKMNMSSCWQVTFSSVEIPSPEFENFLDDYFEVNACNFDDDGNDEYIGYIGNAFSEEDMQMTNIYLFKYSTSLITMVNQNENYLEIAFHAIKNRRHQKTKH